MIVADNDGYKVEINGFEMISLDEFAQVERIHRSWIEAQVKHQESVLALDALHSDLWHEDDQELLERLVELERDRLRELIDDIHAKSEQLWALCPEAVTGGGYDLHKARWEGGH